MVLINSKYIGQDNIRKFLFFHVNFPWHTVNKTIHNVYNNIILKVLDYTRHLADRKFPTLNSLNKLAQH